MSKDCCHLHVHSEYSLLDGATKVEALAARAAEMDQPAMGLTDHGVMNGTMDLIKAAKKHDIKPIPGFEAYFVDDRHFRPEPGRPTRQERNHLTLLAETDEGLRNLQRLSTLGFLEGLYGGKPALDLEALARHSSGIIAMTGCLASRICQTLLRDDPGAARQHADDLLNVCGRDTVYFEVQKNGIPDQEKANAGVVKIARDVGRPLVAAGDVHYLRREDYRTHAALLCVQTKSTLAAPKMTFDTNEFYLKTAAEMASDFAEWPEALASTLEIAERSNVTVDTDRYLIPRYLPEGQDERAYLRDLVQAGLRERYGDPIPAAAIERMEYELGVITKMGFDAYFLIVWDFVKWAKDNGIAVGPGRGSAAGSLVAYALQITDLCPLEHDLLFERFLNPERVSMPDIDIDFSVRGRERVMAYVVEKYGRESDAQIITFGRMFPRAATRDAARVLGHPYQKGDELAKLIPDPEQGRPPSFEDCMQDGAELKAACDADPEAQHIVDLARGFEGVVRNSSSHAAAVVIAGFPLTDVVPLQLAEAGTGADGERQYRQVTQYSMKPVEELGLLKMDFLGLRNLDVIEDALDIIERSGGARPDIASIPMDDAKTFAMIARGDSVGVFQLESEGMQEALKKVRPTEFDDITALVALYRPGAMDQIPAYAAGKADPHSISIPDPRLEPIIRPTMGVILYQEQAMQISKDLAGFTGAQADDLRKAIGKKNREAMAKLKPAFIAGCEANGVARDVIDLIWATNEKSADYSFNKSHAACYALIAYRTAWLKANYPAEYMAALISSVMDTKDKVPFFVDQTERMGIKVLPPDVNISDHEFVVVDGEIRFGLDAVKQVGYGAVESIKAARDRGGPFVDLWDFCTRSGVNKAVASALIACGALDSLPGSRKGKLGMVDAATDAGRAEIQARERGQDSLFDDAVDARPERPAISEEEFDDREKLTLERDAIGLFLSSHPLSGLGPAIDAATEVPLREIDKIGDGETTTVGGMLTGVKFSTTRTKQRMARAVLETVDASIDVLFFQKTLDRHGDLVVGDAVLILTGKVEHKDNGRTTMVAQRVQDLQIDPEQAAALLEAQALEDVAELVYTVEADGVTFERLQAVHAVMRDWPGGSRVILATPAGRMRVGSDAGVQASAEARAAIERALTAPLAVSAAA